MSQVGKCCVLAVDVSGSVEGFKFYWNYVSELLQEVLCKSYSSYRVVCWSSQTHEVTIEILRQYIKDLRDEHAGGTYPDLIWKFLDNEKLSSFDLYLITDGEIDHSRYDRYVDLYSALTVKPDAIHVHYCGRLKGMNMSFLDCFKKVQYVINGLDTNNKIVRYTSTKEPKDVLFNYLCNLPEFKKIEDNAVDKLTEALEELYKILYRKMVEYSENELNGPIGAEFKKFVDLINKVVHRNYMNVCDEGFDHLFDDYKSNSKEIFDMIVKQFLDVTTVDYRKVLSQIIEIGNGHSKVDRRLLAYGEQWYERVKAEMKPSNQSEEDDECGIPAKRMKMMDDEEKVSESNAYCPILLLDSCEYNQFCVVWIGIDKLFGGSEFKAALHTSFYTPIRHKIVRSPMRLFELLSPDVLNRRIPPANQHVSVDAFLGLERTELNYMGYKTVNRVFKSPLHQAPCFGIVLYNADSNVNFPATITQNEMNILLHNYATIALLLFGDTQFVGSFPLLHTFFLQILKQCDRIDPYIKLCIQRSLERTSTILKCRFMLESGLEPSFYSPIKNAILFHTDIYPKEIDKLTKSVPGIESLNIPRKRIQYCSGLLDLAKDLFGVTYSEEYEKKLKLWRFWNYMLCITHMSNHKKLIHFKQIALTKFQNWQPIENGQIKLMLLEGESRKPYLDYLSDVDYEDIVKLIILFETKRVKRLTTNICTKNIKLVENGQWYTIKSIEEIKQSGNIILLVEGGQWYNVKPIEQINVSSCNTKVFRTQFCKAICALPIICSDSKLPLLKCLENQKFSLCDYGYPEKSSIIHAHSYIHKCKTLIKKKSGNEKIMQIPTVDELKDFILRKSPIAVYHSDIDTILENTISKFQTWKKWYENADENEKKKYLWIDSDWKKIFAYNVYSSEDERLQNCDCEAHSYV